MTEPLLLIAGGSGVVPLMAMIRHRAAAGAKNPTSLLYSSRNFEDIIYYNELEKLRATDSGLQVFHALTRSQPPSWKGFARRIDRDMLKEVAQPLGRSVQVLSVDLHYWSRQLLTHWSELAFHQIRSKRNALVPQEDES